MESANFIPLGDVNGLAIFDGLGRPEQKVIGNTKEERKRIAREIGLAAKREKKKVKADAKRQRKQNAILHRRVTHNSEIYNKNKDRSKQRSIDLERQKIRYEAVKQAERMAAKYDMSGKTFNVGEVIILEDGKVKSKAVMQRTEEEKARKEAEIGGLNDAPIEGINPERQAQIQQQGYLATPKPKKISKKQQKKLEMFEPKLVPPRPVIPEGYSLPDGEENLTDLWDITDEGILKRLADQKKEKNSAAKRLRRAQKEEKKLNHAMKALRKEAGNKGILWDPEAAKKKILGEGTYLLEGSDSEEGKSNSESDSNSNSDAEVDWESDDEGKAQKKAKKDKKQRKSSTSEDVDMDGAGKAKGKSKHLSNRPKIDMALLKAAEDKERELAEKKRIVKEKRRVEAKAAAQKAEAETKKAGEETAMAQDVEMRDVKMHDVETAKESKKRKRSKDDEEAVDPIGEEGKKKSKSKKQTVVESSDSKFDALTAAKEQEFLTQNVDIEPLENGKKEKKHKKKSKVSGGHDAIVIEDVDTGEAKVEKKHKKGKKEKKAKEAEAIALEVVEEDTIKLKKKHKKDKKEKKATKIVEEVVAKSHAGAEQWNPDALTGDAARKDKFLRLLGAGKGGVNGEEKSKKRRESGKMDDIRKVDSELERQFEMGMRMKHDGGGKRRGLGS